jgi:hypothetical protein
VQGGGHGILSPNYGLGIDRVVSQLESLKCMPTDRDFVRLNSKLLLRMANIEWQMNARMRTSSGPSVAGAVQRGALFWRPLRESNHNFSYKCAFPITLSSLEFHTHALSDNSAAISFKQTTTNSGPFLKIVTQTALKWGKEGWGGHIGVSWRSVIFFCVVLI